MLSPELLSGLFITHFVADFLLQSDWMATNKSKWHTPEGRKALGAHVLVYSACFLWLGLIFTVLTGLFHLAVDAVTSRWTSQLWFIDLEPREGAFAHWSHYAHIRDSRHWFFVVIGLDQLIHMILLIWTYEFVQALLYLLALS